MLLAMSLLAAVPAVAQHVYRCKNPDGSVTYSDAPCATDPSKVDKYEVKYAGEADPAAVERLQAQGERAAEIRKEQDCVGQRSAGARSASDARVRDYERQIAQLEYDITRSANNAAGAQRDTGLRTEIAALRASISSERTSLDTQLIDIRNACRREASDRTGG